MTSIVTQHETRDRTTIFQPYCAECLVSGPETFDQTLAQTNANLHNTDHHGDTK